jgi:nucleotide-binding universal stress UspA family protein
MTHESVKSAERSGVVVGIDGSGRSRQALAWAARWAKLTGEPLVALVAWHYPIAWGWAVPSPEDFDAETAARQMLESVVAQVLGPDPGIEVTTVVVSGHPATVLVERSEQASLVVVGCRGHGEFAGMLLGSVSEFVVTHARCPVVVVRDHEPAAPAP